jgi:hypothetical protein
MEVYFFMKRIALIVLVVGGMLLAGACGRTAAPQDSSNQKTKNTSQSQAAASSVTVQFDYTWMSTQASNQVAVWVEKTSGHVVKTLYVSDFTGARRGYRARADALPHWVAAADPDAMSDDALDAVSSATLLDGRQSFVWDLTDSEGKAVPQGQYTVKVEGTLYWGSNVVYSGTVDTSKVHSGAVTLKKKRSEPNNTRNADMIGHVKIIDRRR